MCGPVTGQLVDCQLADWTQMLPATVLVVLIARLGYVDT